jgi:hypothetical protein
VSLRTNALAAARHRARTVGRRIDRLSDPVRDLFDPDRTRAFPADPRRMDDYREHFVDSARAFERFLHRAHDIRCGNQGQHVAIVVMPWFGTPVPWYAIALGLALARRGRSVTFVWHDLPRTRRSADVEQHEEIRRALHRLRRRFPVLQTSTFPSWRHESADDPSVTNDLVEQQLIWSTRAATEPTEAELRAADQVRCDYTDALPRIRSLVRTNHFDVLLTPGGVLAGSGLYLHAAAESGVRGATFDTGPGWTVVCTSGVAAQQTDLERACLMLPAEPGGAEQSVVDAARQEFEHRRRGTDAMSYQSAATAPSASDGPRTVLVPLSVMFDTAALGRNHLFPSARDWLVETVATVLRATDDPVVVRQHPSERRPRERSRFDAGAILAEAFGPDPQVRFVPAEDPVNTYDLLDDARLVLPFVSTIGIEAAALGKSVVVGGAVYYADLGFAWSASTRAEYTDLLVRGARGELPELPDQRDRAWRCYYLNAVCQRVWTDFGCQPADYWRWVGREPHALFDEPEVDDLLTAIEDDVPVPLLRHRRLHAQHA